MLRFSRRINNATSINQKVELKNIINEHSLAFNQILRSYFPSLSMIRIQIVISIFGAFGEENIQNANLTSSEKDNLLEIS